MQLPSQAASPLLAPLHCGHVQEADSSRPCALTASLLALWWCCLLLPL